jgi:hypothetical protein
MLVVHIISIALFLTVALTVVNWVNRRCEKSNKKPWES